ncbi:MULTISPECIES: LexA family protein [Dyella]|uniref:Translesion error-prone DNA polymerase V autoproteolytic subunit n=1 Tax=Dyella terrae TaxID=522259 RepID=A0ABY1Z1L7_9GAMM|nr:MULTISPECIES: translesion error-prone DNA polymerase V autoproteolytic subunit [Dyella]TBR40486.1 translesion error-prone DNA polymerase V autoproteolytic subunit [Dyella terrae]
MSPSHGGARPGAGRPVSEPTQRLRVPESQVPTVLAYLDAYRQGSSLDTPRPLSLLPSTVALTAFTSRVPAGHPSPADDQVEDVVDLNQHLIIQGHEPSTYIVRVSGWSMIGAGIFDNDEVLVDRALKPRQGDIVVALVNNELSIKRLGMVDGHVALLPENAHFKPIVFKEGETLELWGVVTRCLRNLR